jgi:hypothetical protein
MGYVDLPFSPRIWIRVVAVENEYVSSFEFRICPSISTLGERVENSRTAVVDLGF